MIKAINSTDKTIYSHYSHVVACYTAGNFATTLTSLLYKLKILYGTDTFKRYPPSLWRGPCS